MNGIHPRRAMASPGVRLAVSVVGWSVVMADACVTVIAPSTPYGLQLLSMLMLVVMAMSSMVESLMAAAVAVAAHCLTIALYGDGLSLRMLPSFGPVIAAYGLAWLAGALCRTMVGNAVLRRALCERAVRRSAVVQLHDQVCNALSCAMMLLDCGEIDESRRVLDEALGTVRQIMRRLDEENDEAAGDALPSSAAWGWRMVTERQLRDMVAEKQRLLSSLGFQGVVLFPEHCMDQVPRRVRATAYALLVELFGNVARHADPKHGYYCSIARSADAMIIELSDVPRVPQAPTAPGTAGDDDRAYDEAGARHDDDHGGKSTGKRTGLSHYRDVCSHLGGSLDVDRTAERWHLRARIPLGAPPDRRRSPHGRCV
ncbi:hypothetical protein G1C96_1727 [Bifidobacterium sp. DSM 109958]|uniref:Signal transduction histidine kinase-like protein n=1 Tax=Bifidobacterium moraviense TaxID=2675323 RepID=A0A7Y0F4W1_9BIFI|nr:hypothetical protein [Bifidobacterium sp. DSM 109958]NMN01142.1 hypothetical protein [Bifidobacterium sp. DSM 109958]